MKRQKMKKALLRLSCLACVLLTLCTCFAVSAFAAGNANVPWGEYYYVEIPLSDFVIDYVKDRPTDSIRFNQSIVTYKGVQLNPDPVNGISGQCTNIGFLTDGGAFVSSYSVAGLNEPGTAAKIGQYAIRYDVQEDGYYDCTYIAHCVEHGTWEMLEIDPSENIKIYASTSMVGGSRNYFGRYIEHIDTSSMSYLIRNVFGGFGTTIGGMAGGMKSAFSSLIYVDGVSGSFSPLVIFLFSMLGLGLAAGIVYKIVSLVRNRR